MPCRRTPTTCAAAPKSWRNRDQAFERLLEKDSAERRIGVALTLDETADGFAVAMVDEDGIAARAAVAHAKSRRRIRRALVALGEALGKLGATEFHRRTR